MPRAAANEYAFVTTWHVPATANEIAAVLGDAPGLTRWWPSVYLKVAELAPGDGRGIGKVVDLHTKGWLRELSMKALGMKAVLPPPEEKKHVKTAIGQARAEQSRKSH